MSGLGFSIASHPRSLTHTQRQVEQKEEFLPSLPEKKFPPHDCQLSVARASAPPDVGGAA